MLQRLCWFLVVLSVILVLVCAAGAQTAASINGTVTDASGALVQHAIVTATNTATNIDHTADTGTSGVYSIPQL
ncbi:MAG: carboxypeptidase-like regulatory domain-containing protein, partial [Candidatus Sulfotelmatobacter sp.]